MDNRYTPSDDYYEETSDKPVTVDRCTCGTEIAGNDEYFILLPSCKAYCLQCVDVHINGDDYGSDVRCDCCGRSLRDNELYGRIMRGRVGNYCGRCLVGPMIEKYEQNGGYENG